ncbi:sensor histidine kinase [Brevibacillus borstelensis]|uniref:sensor histidine kinase n=1 Tax=Brevibacillus borstelensis TaxID=45462 RepID=UPI000F097A49|nr:HAMP domain-containing sensor histidine kinase [Brevibacillus borstelensis]MBE5398369.1 HAMP domain-containing histidine kinase [Brevibacillus borstelensis]MCC0564806.1 HAMP domain-containing histidine kinase [Brevibacillus borstelensis]MCM3471059.1 HAMP domain-containing histidine kinase [Brevibacillus borstelensis]MED1881407.1 HAMP domain-containing sensor histidine kinase [Brevibacillus borstelensis]NOU53606.1 HAMP domain-containing histidine kinase [Brevibacillus borstelensis]
MSKFRLKNLPLSRQILILFMLLTSVLGIGVGIVFPFAVKQYLVNNTYSLLEQEFYTLSDHISFNEHNELLPVPAAAPYFLQVLLSRYEYSFDMIVFSTDGVELGSRITERERFSYNDAAALYKKAASYPGNKLQHGTLERGGEDYLFVSRLMDYHGFPYYMVLFSKERELNQINSLLTRQFLMIFVVLLLISWLLAVWFSRYLSKPLRSLDESCQKIARRQFDTPLTLDRGDEIGQLARSFETMKDQLKEHDESQRHFVQNISHELKTPIMAIQGYTQGLLEGVFQGPQAEKGLQTIMQESKRLEKVVGQLLYLTKIESVSQMMQMGRVDVTEMFQLLEQRLSVLNPDISWQLDLPPALILEGDGEQLSTAFVNILENQLRYAKSQLVVTGRQADDRVVITIANDGPPIEEALLPQLFQRFRKGKSGKHGLGLAIARAVFEAHKGSIAVRNEAEGPCFTITLPVKR